MISLETIREALARLGVAEDTCIEYEALLALVIEELQRGAG